MMVLDHPSGYYPNVGGSFLANGSWQAFSTVRRKRTGGNDFSFELTYSEMYRGSASNPPVVANANKLWQIAARNVKTNKLYATGPLLLHNIYLWKGVPAGDYVLVCRSLKNHFQPPMLAPYIRFGGKLTIR